MGMRGKNPRFKLEWPELCYQLNGLSKSREGDNLKGKFSLRYAEMETIERHPSRKEKALRQMYRVAHLQGTIIQTNFKEIL